MAEVVEKFRLAAGEHVYSESDEPLEIAVAKLLWRQTQTIAVAESCTGGLLAHRLTNVSGSSKYLESAIVAYSNIAKMELLDVAPVTLLKFGAVSEQCAREMAQGIRHRANSDIGISTTGIAGPTGATPTKPLGLVYIGYCDGLKCTAHSFRFVCPREVHKQRTVQMALYLLWQELKKQSG